MESKPSFRDEAIGSDPIGRTPSVRPVCPPRRRRDRTRRQRVQKWPQDGWAPRHAQRNVQSTNDPARTRRYMKIFVSDRA